ncbi:Uncharacterised protein family (UPF0259) [Pseudomonas flavescens]|uniref:Uncharacterized protein family (UPF0259) n=1 Tax=Phytopseudomonas flavescens TaxID=29435 RepID=A0A1G8NLH2_9GAMM|nr:YciC family protein [Pseudomonas flavescens]SDI81025.1 Uncharacterised protein family (UPF0259) [Pseudomonas flavescens]
MKPLDALRDAWFFFRQNLLQIILLCLPFLLLEAALSMQLEGLVAAAKVPLYDVLLGLLFYPLYSAALILFIDARSRGEQPARGALVAMSLSLSLWPRFVLLAGIGTLAIMLGASLFILPGLWLMVRLVFSDYLLVLRGMSPLQALHQSLQLTHGHFWPILTCVMLVMVPPWLVGFWAGDIAAEPAGRLLLDLLLGLFQLFTTVVVFRLYMLRTGDNTAP